MQNIKIKNTKTTSEGGKAENKHQKHKNNKWGREAEQKNKKTGNFGDVGIYSSSTTKTLDTYGGGLCVTNDSLIYEKLIEFQNNLQETNRVVLLKKVIQDFLRNLATNMLFFNLVTIRLLRFLDLINKNNTTKYVGSRSTEKTLGLPKEYFYQFSSFQAKQDRVPLSHPFP